MDVALNFWGERLRGEGKNWVMKTKNNVVLFYLQRNSFVGASRRQRRMRLLWIWPGKLSGVTWQRIWPRAISVTSNTRPSTASTCPALMGMPPRYGSICTKNLLTDAMWPPSNKQVRERKHWRVINELCIHSCLKSYFLLKITKKLPFIPPSLTL